MDNKVIVFDFDKTLTYTDSLFGFFLTATEKNITYPVKVLLYIFIMVFAKLKVLSNKNMKRIGIALFLKGIDKIQLQLLSIDYSKKIKLNNLYHEFDFMSNDKIYIASASFAGYLRPLFPSNVTILGSQLLFKENKVAGLKENCFKGKKAQILLAKGINTIDVVYTDSYSDFPLACMSEKIIIVNGDNTHECKNIEEFNSYFGKSKK